MYISYSSRCYTRFIHVYMFRIFTNDFEYVLWSTAFIYYIYVCVYIYINIKCKSFRWVIVYNSAQLGFSQRYGGKKQAKMET